MSECTIIDTFPAFLSFWEGITSSAVEDRVDRWASEYMSQWPELLNKQKEDYKKEHEDWKAIACERVFPFLDDRLPAMRTAHENLLRLCAPTFSKSVEALTLEADILFVIYVGIGCGAGWATSYGNHPAVLFGLEMIAECGYSEPPSLTGVIAHEIGHVAHDLWRSREGRKTHSGPWWQLYSEGFAQRCEHLILGEESWHQSIGVNAPDWIDWCRSRKGWLASEFIRQATSKRNVRPFFGSWFDIEGRRECGYFLGHEVVRELQKDRDMIDIALMDDFEERSRSILIRYAEEGN
jgi:hypothetical protein